MCGIAGIYNFSRSEAVDATLLKRMNDLLEHRGPDDEGFYVKGKIGLSMRRLSIIDLSTGHQPLSSDDSRIQLVFNGEIYNFQHLRQELIEKGIHFKTNSDTEVILRLYEQLGVDCLRKLRGMFAFAIWDESRERLFIARDRIGKKPLVYTCSNGQLAWASEIRSLLQVPGISNEVDSEAIDLYLGLQYIPSPWTAFRSIRKLPPAHYLLLEKGQMKVERYWDLPLENKNESLSLDEAKVTLKEKFKEATRIRMISDVPLGAFLSGGVDSTLVVGMMSQLSSRPVKTFAIGFDEEEFCELKYAREAAAFFKTDHTEFIVKPKMTDVLPKLAWHYGEPFGDSSALPSYYLAQETRKHVTVALTGDGGDENFGGYQRYRAMKLVNELDWIPQSIRESFKPLAPFLPRKGQRFVRDVLAAPAASRYFNVIGIFSEREKQEMYTPEFMGRVASLSRSLNYLNAILDRSQNLDFVNQLLYLDFSSYLPECLIAKVDIATMANSLEARSPLLDHELIEFAFGLPGNWKLRGCTSSKWILKEALKEFLPPSIATRSKMGFGIPLAAWFRGELKDYWIDHVLSSKALSRGYFQKRALEKIFDEHISGKRDHGYRMWVLLMLEMWHLVCVSGG